MDARGEIHGFLTDREIARASIAKWWRTQPFVIRGIAKRELRIMGEFMQRVLKAEDEAREAAKYGQPTPGRAPRGRPQAGDVIHDGKGDVW